MSQGWVVIFRSPDGKSGWEPLMPEEVPDWIKEPNVLGTMIDGHLAHNEAEPESPWFAAVTGAPPQTPTEEPLLLKAPEPFIKVVQ